MLVRAKERWSMVHEGHRYRPTIDCDRTGGGSNEAENPWAKEMKTHAE